jgi:hypothetical protein
MNGCLREVDRDNLPAFLGCPDLYLPFFTKFDFDVIGEFEYEGIRIVCLYREPQDRTIEDIEEGKQPEGKRPRRSTRSSLDEGTTTMPKVYRDGLDDALLGDDPIPGLDDTIDLMLQGFFEKLSKITH